MFSSGGRPFTVTAKWRGWADYMHERGRKMRIYMFSHGRGVGYVLSSRDASSDVKQKSWMGDVGRARMELGGGKLGSSLKD